MILSSGHKCGDQWLKSDFLFLYRNDGISVYVLVCLIASYMYFLTEMNNCFFVVNISLEL